MTKYRVAVALIAAVALLGAGCGGGEDDSGSTATTPPTTAAEETTTTTTTTVAAAPMIAGLDTIEQLTALAGGGDRPLLAWVPVMDAEVYVVVVYDEESAPYWAAVTTETQVYVGGPVQIPEGNDGPRIAAGYSWSVYAEDAEGLVIGASALRSISP